MKKNIPLLFKIIWLLALFFQCIVAQGEIGDTLLLKPKLKTGDLFNYKVTRETALKNGKPVIETKKFSFYVDSVSDKLYFLHYTRLISKEEDKAALAPEIKQEVEQIKLKFTINHNGLLVSLTNENAYYKACNQLTKNIISKYDKESKKNKKKKVYVDLYFEYQFITPTHMEFAENLAAVFSTRIMTILKDSVFKQESGLINMYQYKAKISGFHFTRVLKNNSTDSNYIISQEFTPDFNGYYNFIVAYIESKNIYFERTIKDAEVVPYIENEKTKITEQWMLEHHKSSGINTKVNYERRYQIFDNMPILLTQYKFSINIIP